MLQSSTIQFSMRRVAAAVAAAFIAAAVFVQFDRTPQAALSAGVAGQAMMQMLRDDHAVIADYLKSEAEAQKLANAAATREMEGMKLAVRTDAPAQQRVAQAERESKRVMAALEKKAAPAKLEPVRVTTAVAPGEPMQLLAMTEVRTTPQPPNGVVRGKLRQLASTVERIPSWFNAAAGWVVEAVPVPRMPSLPQLPMRHFRV
jgi:hypothetical protein